MPIPPIVVKLLIMLGIDLVKTVGPILAKQVRARFTALADSNPNLQGGALTEAANEVANVAGDVIKGLEQVIYSELWSSEEIKGQKREIGWKDLRSRMLARGIEITENYARGEIESALLDIRMEKKAPLQGL